MYNQGPALQQAAQLLKDGKIKSVIDSEFTFDNAIEAYTRQMSGRYVQHEHSLASFRLMCSAFEQIQGKSYCQGGLVS